MASRILTLALFGLSVVFGLLYYAHYFRWRGCFNDQGRCFDEATGVVYSEQSGIVWLLLTATTLAAALWLALRRRSRRP